MTGSISTNSVCCIVQRAALLAGALAAAQFVMRADAASDVVNPIFPVPPENAQLRRQKSSTDPKILICGRCAWTKPFRGPRDPGLQSAIAKAASRSDIQAI